MCEGKMLFLQINIENILWQSIMNWANGERMRLRAI